MVLLAIPIVIAVLLLFLRISKSIGKFIAVFIDFLLIGGFVINFTHKAISTKIASGNAVYFWNITFAIIACVLYYFLLIFLILHLPKLAALVNYFIAWIGTFVVYFIIFSIINGGLPELLNNKDLSMLTNLVIVSLLAFITLLARKNMFNIEEMQADT